MIFQLASTLSHKEILLKSKLKSSFFIENPTRVPLKLEQPGNCPFYKICFLLNIRSRQLCYGCIKTTLYNQRIFPICKNNTQPNKNKKCSRIWGGLSSVYRPVSDAVMHINEKTGPLWRIYSKAVITFELVWDFVIWIIVTKALRNFSWIYHI